VKDDGIGISAEQLPELFQFFSQVDHTSSRSEGGLGIGLALVKQLVELHDGKINASSDGLGTGSEFTIRLPAAKRPDRAISKPDWLESLPKAPAQAGHDSRAIQCQAAWLRAQLDGLTDHRLKQDDRPMANYGTPYRPVVRIVVIAHDQRGDCRWTLRFIS
jgi:hypothetical protein